eukprot:1870070-Rhodomonas_salina.2
MHMHVRRQRRLRRGRWCGEGKGGRGSRTVLALPRLLPLRVLVLGLMRMLILQGWVKVSNDVARLSAVSGRSRDKRGPLRTVYVSLTFYKHAATDGRRMRKVAPDAPLSFARGPSRLPSREHLGPAALALNDAELFGASSPRTRASAGGRRRRPCRSDPARGGRERVAYASAPPPCPRSPCRHATLQDQKPFPSSAPLPPPFSVPLPPLP